MQKRQRQIRTEGQTKDRQRQRQTATATAKEKDNGEGNRRSFDCASRDEAARSFAQDDTSWKRGSSREMIVAAQRGTATARVRYALAAVGGWDHDGVGVDVGDAEVAAEMDEVEGAEFAGDVDDAHVAGARVRTVTPSMSGPVKWSQRSVTVLWGWAVLAAVWLALTRCFQPAAW
jgi:hypothetical protein